MSALPRPSDLSSGEAFAHAAVAELERQVGGVAKPTIRLLLIKVMASAYAQGRLDERNHAEAPPGAVGEA